MQSRESILEEMIAAKSNTQLIFFLLTFLFTLPVYILVALVSNNILFNTEKATFLIPLEALSSISAGLIMATWNNGRGGMKELFRRDFDFKRITKLAWYERTLKGIHNINLGRSSFSVLVLNKLKSLC